MCRGGEEKVKQTDLFRFVLMNVRIMACLNYYTKEHVLNKIVLRYKKDVLSAKTSGVK